MAINRFSNLQQPERFSPLSFQELSFAPITLRDREDTILNQQDELLNTLNNIEVPDIYQDQFKSESDKYRSKIEQMAKQLQSEGAGNLNILGEFRNLRNDFNKSISKTGNIGRAAMVQADIDSNKDAFYKFAIDQGWGNNPELIDQKWQEELEKYKKNLPTDLNKFSGRIPEMMPSQAPKNVDLAEEMTKLSKIIGENAEALKDFSLVPGPIDPETGKPTNFIIVNSEGQEVTNVPQLNSLKNYIEKQVFDSSSGLNAALRFRGMSPEDFLGQVDDLVNVMSSVKQVSGNSYAGQTAVTKNTTTKTGTGKTPKVKTARLVETDNGNTRVQKSNTSGNIKNQILEINQDPTLTPEEKNAEITRLNHLLVKRQKLENNESYKKAVNAELMKDDFFSTMGITNINDYNEYITSPEANETIRQRVVSAGTGAPGTLMNTGQTMAEYAQEKFQNLSEALPEAAFNDFVINSSYYSLGTNEDSDKLNSSFGSAIQNLNLKAFATRGDLAIRNITGGDDPDESTTIPHTDYEGFALDIANAGTEKVDYKLKAVETGGLAGKPSIIFDVKAKVGDNTHKYTASLFLDNNPQSKDILRTLEEELDPSSASVIRSIKDNLEYSSVKTVIQPDVVNFDKSSTVNILEHAAKRDRTENVVSYVGDGMDNFKFVKNDGSNYSISINQDNSYSTYKEDEDGNVIPLTFYDHFKRTILPGIRAVNPDRNISSISREQEAISAINYLNLLVEQQRNNINYIYNPIEPEFKKALEDYNKAYEATSNIEDRKEAALNALNRIKNLKVYSKNIKEVL